MSTLPQLEEKIYSLVPELKELTFGCKVKHYRTGKKHKFISMDYEYKKYFRVMDDGENIFGAKNATMEIIGHEIHPHHFMTLLGNDYAISGGGHIIKNDGKDSYEYCTYYDFKKSFKDQSPELHQFLMENIK